MKIVNYTEARKNLKTILDRVADDEDYTIIFRRDAEDAVIMSKSHYDSLIETLYLLSSPKNAQRLNESIAALREGKFEEHDLIDA
jgi:antitoxin YefM